MALRDVAVAVGAVTSGKFEVKSRRMRVESTVLPVGVVEP